MVFKLLLFGICVVGCTHVNPVVLPEPQNHTRPVLDVEFYNCTEDEKEVCISLDDAQAILIYMTDVETDLRKCAITVHEVNRERKDVR